MIKKAQILQIILFSFIFSQENYFNQSLYLGVSPAS